LRILLVEPSFPIPNKSKNHSNFLPIGLLKLASYYRNRKYQIQLVRGNIKKEEITFKPDKIFITSLFTYWSEYVRNCTQHYSRLFPKAKIIVGGIYASLMPDHCKEFTGCDRVFVGLHKGAEKCFPAYDLVSNPHPLGYQILHTSRGCFRKCSFCGVWKVEPEIVFKKTIKKEICSNKLIFYDNNLLTNPNIEQILTEIANSKFNGRCILCESQSGFDGRLLNLKLAKLLKKARFIYPRIAWDGVYSKYSDIKRQVDILKKAGYKSKDIYVFVLYNWKISFEDMEKKRLKCWDWGVQIADCRYRPLDQTYDYYNPRKKQTCKDYYIDPGWSDNRVKQFRRNIRRHNICIRHGFKFYSRELEVKTISKNIAKNIKDSEASRISEIVKAPWFPHKFSEAHEENMQMTLN